jgi:deoxyribodipyrimidine photolyase-related protein
MLAQALSAACRERPAARAKNAQESRSAAENLPGVPAPLRMAEKMGAGLGAGTLLLRSLPRGGATTEAHPFMTAALRFVFGDQLTRSLSALIDLDRERDVVLMVEVRAETGYVPHHKQKIALILSAMRHFAEALRREGVRVDYVRLDEPDNTHSFTGELARAIARHDPAVVVLTEPGEWRVWEMMRDWQRLFAIPFDIREDDRFLCSRNKFARWAKDRRQLRMEYFYREMRKATGLLMDGDAPEGGQWNYDAQNRKPLPHQAHAPPPRAFAADTITREVLDLVAGAFADHFGELEPFRWGVTREDALDALADFIERRLPLFGDYQDAMRSGEDFLFHAALSPYLNIGLLSAQEVCTAAERAYRNGQAPLNAVEGFIRQIIGWREYVRGLYWTYMPRYAQTNELGAHRPLPSFYWSGETDMQCLHETIRSTRQNAYAHHIQRLMVTGNFALLAGIAPAAIEEWYLAVYADAYEWVELPNVHGMVMHADGGLLGSKPYAASGAYINRMSNYCAGCRYDPKEKNGPMACPFNYLYWNFLWENREKFASNPRMAMPMKTLAAFDAKRLTAIRQDSNRFLDGVFPQG